jgi:hypothetical protein
MKLIRNQKRIDRIAEKQQIRPPDGLERRSKILLQRLDASPSLDVIKLKGRKLFLQIQAGMQGDRVSALGTAADDEYLHALLFGRLDQVDVQLL